MSLPGRQGLQEGYGLHTTVSVRHATAATERAVGANCAVVLRSLTVDVDE
jgi:hypothetical protein